MYLFVLVNISVLVNCMVSVEEVERLMALNVFKKLSLKCKYFLKDYETIAY